jgi:hypothetical protein
MAMLQGTISNNIPLEEGGKLTLLSRQLSNLLRNNRRTPKIDAQIRISASLQYLRDIKRILSKLVIGAGNMSSAELDSGKCIEALENEPSRRGCFVETMDGRRIRPIAFADPPEIEIVETVVRVLYYASSEEIEMDLFLKLDHGKTLRELPDPQCFQKRTHTTEGIFAGTLISACGFSTVQLLSLRSNTLNPPTGKGAAAKSAPARDFQRAISVEAVRYEQDDTKRASLSIRHPRKDRM